MPRTMALLAFIVASCNAPPKDPPPTPDPQGHGELPKRQAAKPSPIPHDVITADLLREHTKALSDDAMQGRRPGTDGGRRAVEYIVTAMKDLGLQPAADKSYTQRVPMRGVTTNAAKSSLNLVPAKGKARALAMSEDIVAGTYRTAGRHRIDAPIVFAGYGVTAPEYDWDDYAGLDVRGKVVVVFVGDPPVADGRFGGPAMTYYGRWSYKFERALQAGAMGCLVIHETEPASYGWNVVRNSWSSERFHIVEPDGELPNALGLQGWLSRKTAASLAEASGTTLEQWHSDALLADFRAREIPLRLAGRLVTTERRLTDRNVLAKVTGRTSPDESLIVTAHWDHLGVKPNTPKSEDAVYNGAIDNASGIAVLLALAAAMQNRVEAGQPPARSIVFLATTAEEQGLLGSRYFAEYPTVRLERTLAVVNLDSPNVHGRTNTVQVVGPGQSSLEDVLAAIAESRGRRVVPDSRPSSGGYYRSDHFSFARKGVPALYFRAGLELEQGGEEAGVAIAKARAGTYHTVHDEYDERWSFEGTEQDAKLVFELLWRVAQDPEPPKWTDGSEFAKIRR